jgi:hypothetical protein
MIGIKTGRGERLSKGEKILMTFKKYPGVQNIISLLSLIREFVGLQTLIKQVSYWD